MDVGISDGGRVAAVGLVGKRRAFGAEFDRNSSQRVAEEATAQRDRLATKRVIQLQPTCQEQRHSALDEHLQ